MGILPGARVNTGETSDKSITDLKMSVLEKNHEGPVFKEPWQAQVFAMAGMEQRIRCQHPVTAKKGGSR